MLESRDLAVPLVTKFTKAFEPIIKFQDEIQTLILGFRGFARVLRFDNSARLIDSTVIKVDANRMAMIRSDLLIADN